MSHVGICILVRYCEFMYPEKGVHW